MASGWRSFSGWIKGIPSSRASVLTGGALSSRPRPEARSGWVTTPATLYELARARRDGSEKSGEPMKTTLALRAANVLVMRALYQYCNF